MTNFKVLLALILLEAQKKDLPPWDISDNCVDGSLRRFSYRTYHQQRRKEASQTKTLVLKFYLTNSFLEKGKVASSSSPTKAEGSGTP